MAAEPAFRIASVTEPTSAVPNFDDAARALITRLASVAGSWNWFRAEPSAAAASGKLSPVASARATASFVTAVSALADESKSGLAEAISLNAVAASDADREVVLPISAACSE